MNGRERYFAMLAGEKTDYVPCTPILMRWAAEYIGTNYAEFTKDHRVLVKANIKAARDFGFDQVSSISESRETHGFGGEVYFDSNDGALYSHLPLADSRDLSLLQQPDPFAEGSRMYDRVLAVRLYKEQVYNEFSILGWVEGPAASAADLRGVENFCTDLIEEPEFTEALLDKCLQAAVDFAAAQVEAGADTIGVGDAIASQISPRHYKKYIQPRELKLVQAIKSMGAKVKLHICGNITHLLSGIAELGIDILDVDHMVELNTVREAIGNKVAIAGNIDPVEALLFGKPEDISAYMQHAYSLSGNPFLINAGCEVPPGTPLANMKALCKKINYKRY